MQNHNVNMNRCLGEPEACKTARRCAAVLMVMLVGLLATANTALAHVTMQLDPFGEASAAGKDILDLRRVTVVIFGSDHLNPKDVEKETLRLGSRDTVGAQPKAFPQLLQDVNGDGFKDRLAEFELRKTGLEADRHIHAALTGSLRDGTTFVAYDSVVSSDPVCYCNNVSNDLGVIGIRCTYSSSLEPLDLPTLIGNINTELEQQGLTIDSDPAVVVESWAGKGHMGNSSECTKFDTAHPGDGGDRGYARTVQTLSDIVAELTNGTDLYIYVGEDGPQPQAGGSSSVAIGQELSDTNNPLTDVTKPSTESVFAIAGAGGGGGKGNCANGTNYGGYHGGAGGVSVATTTEPDSEAGEDGSNGNEGHGGNSDGNGTGGAAHHSQAGTNGIGGLGSDLSNAMWNGSTADWSHGQGGHGGHDEDAGGGGGGFGGGSGGSAESNHIGGGGGGGSWARQSTVDESTLSSDLVQGSSYDPGQPEVSITFPVIPIP